MRPLEGVRILDLTHALAGPFCTYHLALFGADIVKIEPPGTGDDFRGYSPAAFAALNGGKRSVVLDLKSDEGRGKLAAMIPAFDVLIENFRPGVAARMGIEWETVRAANPRMVYCSISGFGNSGRRAQWPAVEWSVQAATGLSSMYLTEDDDPRHLGIGMLDVFAGTTALTAILAALLEVNRTGEGQHLEVTLADAALSLASPGLEAQLSGDRPGAMPRRPFVGRFRARDRQVFIMAAHQRWFEAVSKVLGEPFLHEDERFTDPASREANREELLLEIEQRLRLRDAREWQDALLAAGVPASAVETLRSAVEDGLFEGAGVIQEVDVESEGTRQRVAGATFSGRTIRHSPGRVPELGADTNAVLQELGLA